MCMKIISLICSVVAVLLYYQGYDYDDILKIFERPPTNSDKLFTAEELSQYNGEKSKFLYLSLLGKVYDVTSGSKHYGPGSNYHIFVGRDASKSFISGDFSEDSDDLDDALSLSNSGLIGLDDWQQMYEKQYIYKGKLIGRFYNKNGDETNYYKLVKMKLSEAKVEKIKEEENSKIYPTCNVEWSATTGSRVWCTNKSGGISRKWDGVPRMMHTPGLSEPHCVCVNQNNVELLNSANVKEYEGCESTSSVCFVKDV